MKKKKTKKRIKLKSVLIFFLIIGTIALLVFLYRSLPVKNIYVIGNNVLREQEIIDEAELSDYPKIYQVSKDTIRNNLLKNELINDVDVSISLFGKVTISIDENVVLYQNNSGEYTLSNYKDIVLNDKFFDVPTLINSIDDDVREKFIDKFLLVDKSIMLKISEIEYAKTEIDAERFLFYMNDGNYVYVTLSKMNLINSYNEIYPTLGDKKGILYLDSGNHFVIKKD